MILGGRISMPGRRTARLRGHRVAAQAIGAPMVAAVLVLVSGCASIPADPQGTLGRVSGGTLRVGISQNEPWTLTGDPEQPAGLDVELVESFAEQVDADVEWTEGSEAVLVRSLERGELDLLVAGFTDDTPWTDRAAVTRSFAEVTNEHGEPERHVMLAAMGENAFLSKLEGFLSEQEVVR